MQNNVRSNGLGVRVLAAACFAAVIAASCPPLLAERLDELALDRWKQVREVERYQLQIAEKYYRENNWKVALSEYEKFLTLYDRSEAAPYCQLKWSLCQRNLRQQNTAIKEGFQSVIDYWPDSPDAVAAAYYIANTYKGMGETTKAKKSYDDVLKKYPKHLVAAYSALDMIDLASVTNDIPTKVKMWKLLVYESERDRESRGICENASRELAVHHFYEVAFDEAVKSLATTYTDPNQLAAQVAAYARQPVSTLTGDSMTKTKGDRLADLAIAWLREKTPADRSTDEAKIIAMQYSYHVADVNASARRDDKVVEVYDQILKVFGPDDGTLGRFAAWYKSVGKYDDARRTYAQFANNIEGSNQIANSYREERKYDDSVKTYRQLSLADADNSIKWIAQVAYTWRHYAHNYPEAIKVYQELMQLDVDNFDDWLWNLADAYHHAGQYKEAIQNYRQCNKNYPETHFRMASCQRQLKQHNEAIILYTQIIGTEKGSAPRAQLEIAYTLKEQGNTEGAILAYQKVCKQYPKTGQASEAHDRLRIDHKINITLGGAKDE